MSALSNLVNVCLDPLLMFGVGMGIAGAGAATAASQLFSAAAYVTLLLQRRSTVKVPVFAVLQLARCAFPGRAWRLRAAWYSQSEAPATKRPATAAGARASRLQRRRFHLL